MELKIVEAEMFSLQGHLRGAVASWLKCGSNPPSTAKITIV